MNLKRFFDFVVALLGIAATAPLLLAIAAGIKLESRGPVLYRCRRVGHMRREFRMLKFRTMIDNADAVDCKLCADGDVRVTRFGAFLRRTKLNELPQLFNVLKGEMSFVGPRPEDPKFLRYYADQWDVVLSVVPGIVGPNQIVNRNEDDLFPSGEDPENFYVERILPDKLERDIAYVRNPGLWSDFVLLLKGVYVTVFRGFSLHRMFQRPSQLLPVFADVCLSDLAYLIANLIKYETVPATADVLWNFVIIGILNPIVFHIMGLYRRSVRFISVPDVLLMIRISVVCGALLIVLDYFLLIGSRHSRVVYFLYPMFLMIFIVGSRVAMRIVTEWREVRGRPEVAFERLLIYGAGRLGAETLRRARFEPGTEVLGFVDDDSAMKGRSVLGVNVLGSGADLAFLRQLHRVDKVLIAFKPEDSEVLHMVEERCREAGFTSVVNAGSQVNGSRVVAGEPGVSAEGNAYASAVKSPNGSRRVLVVGGAGYLGSVMVRRLLSSGYKVRVLDALIYGNAASIQDLADHPGFSFVHGDLCDGVLRDGILDGVTDVVLLAALVGDPICRKYADQARRINLEGSVRLHDDLHAKGVARFVFASTCSNYGLRSEDSGAAEDAELNPKSLYAETKVAVEQHILGSSAQMDFSPTILRIATAYGLSPRMRFDLTVSEFTRELALGRELLVYDENTWRPYCHVQDIARAVESVLESPVEKVRGQVFNVGSDSENYTKKMIVDFVSSVVANAGVRYKEGGFDPRNYRVCFDKISGALGFRSSYTVRGTASRLVDAIRGGLFNDVDSHREFYGNYSVRL